MARLWSIVILRTPENKSGKDKLNKSIIPIAYSNVIITSFATHQTQSELHEGTLFIVRFLLMLENQVYTLKNIYACVFFPFETP